MPRIPLRSVPSGRGRRILAGSVVCGALVTFAWLGMTATGGQDSPATTRAGLPGPLTTGPPPGTTFTRIDGDLAVSTAGITLDGLDIHGRVTINAPNVTLQNSIVRGPDSPGAGSYGLVSNAGGHPGLVIVDSELAPSIRSPWANGIVGSGFTALRVNIHDVVDQVHILGDDVTIKDSWLHDNLHFPADPNQGGNPTHDDSVQVQAGRGILIEGNRISGAYNAGLQVTQGRGPVSDLVFRGNRAGGGGCVVNISEDGGGPMTGLVIADNVFDTDARLSNCAIIAPARSTPAGDGNLFTDGSPVVVRPGR